MTIHHTSHYERRKGRETRRYRSHLSPTPETQNRNNVLNIQLPHRHKRLYTPLNLVQGTETAKAEKDTGNSPLRVCCPKGVSTRIMDDSFLADHDIWGNPVVFPFDERTVDSNGIKHVMVRDCSRISPFPSIPNFLSIFVSYLSKPRKTNLGSQTSVALFRETRRRHQRPSNLPISRSYFHPDLVCLI